MKTLRWLAVGFCLVGSVGPVASAADEVEPSRYTLADLGFLAGCWGGSFGGGSGEIEEFYTSPSANLILGTTRYLKDGEAVQYEFTRIETTPAGLLMTPYPGGVASEHAFVLTSVGGGVAVFEAPEHDYPKRIIYRTNPDGSRTARVDGGPTDLEGQEWAMQRIACP